MIETAASVRDTKRLMFHPDWRIVGAIGYLWFDIAVLFACFAAAGQTPPLAPVVLAYQIGYLSNFIPVPGGIGVLDGSLIGMLVLYGDRRDGGHGGDARLPRDRAVGPGRLGHDRVRRAAEDQEAADRPAQPARGTAPAVPLIWALRRITTIRRGRLTWVGAILRPVIPTWYFM